MTEDIYSQYLQARESQPFEGAIMPYGWGGLPVPVSGRWMVYSLMFEEFSRELANIINNFTDHAARLAAWSVVVSPLSDQRKLEVGREFVDDLATVSLNLPYVIRSRFMFASAHLSHQANHLRLGSDWEDNLPLDHEIYQAVFDTHASPWKRPYIKLKRSLEKIGGSTYQEATLDFRNAYNHRFSVRFMVGIMNSVARVPKPGGGFFYRIGGLPPLELATITTLLHKELGVCYEAFAAFQALVRAQEVAIAADCARTAPT